jgi:hypothetical protein
MRVFISFLTTSCVLAAAPGYAAMTGQGQSTPTPPSGQTARQPSPQIMQNLRTGTAKPTAQKYEGRLVSVGPEGLVLEKSLSPQALKTMIRTGQVSLQAGRGLQNVVAGRNILQQVQVGLTLGQIKFAKSLLFSDVKIEIQPPISSVNPTDRIKIEPSL